MEMYSISSYFICIHYEVKDVIALITKFVSPRGYLILKLPLYT